MTTTEGTRPDAASGRAGLVCAVDRSVAFTEVSDAFCTALGWRPEELLGTSASSLVHPEDRGQALEQAAGMLAEGRGFDPVWRVRHASGDYRWYRVDVTPLLDGDGSVAGATAVLVDVDQAEAARVALVDSEHRYRLLVQNSYDVVAHTVGGVLRWISPSITALAGWTPDELIGRTTSHLWHPDDRDQARSLHEAAELGGAGDDVLRLQRKDGAYVCVDVAVHRDGEPEELGVVVTLRDATARVSAMQALRDSEHEYRLIAENAGDMVALFGVDGRIEWVSPSIMRLLGVTAESMIGRTLVERMHVDDLPGRKRAMDTIDSGAPAHLEGRFAHADGHYVWLGAHIRPVFDDAGQVIARLGTLHEVTREVEARQALQAREAEYRTLAENAADIVFRLDAEGRMTWLSPSIRTVLGYPPEALLGRDPTELLHPDDVPGRERAIAASQDGRTAYEGRYRDVDGHYHWLAITGHGVVDDRGQIVGRVGTAREIDAEVGARTALAASESTFRLLAENSADVVFRTDLEGVVEWISPSVERALGWRPEDLVGRGLGHLVHPDDVAARDAGRSEFAAGRTSAFLVRYRHGDGRWIWMSVSGAPLTDGSGAVVGHVASARDASTEVEARQALEAREAEYRLLAENSADIVFRADPTMVVQWVSPSVRAAIGWDVEDFVGRRISEWVHPDDLALLMAGNREGGGAQTSSYEARFRCGDGSYKWYAVAVRSVLDDDGRVVARVGSSTDVSAAVAAREALEASEEMFRSVMDSSTIGMAVVGLDQRFRAVNPALRELVGRGEEWFAVHTAVDLAPVENRERATGDGVPYFADGTRSLTDVVRLLRADGSEIWARRAVILIRDAEGRPSYYVAQLQDISAELQLEYTSFHDQLTGLRNRQWIVDNLEDELRAARRSMSSVGVLFIDLDNFKVVNDSLGHSAGDELLAAIGHRLLGAMRPGDHVGRFGGDEFVVVIPEIEEIPDLDRICGRVLDQITPPVDVQGHRITPSASIGVAVSTLDSSAQSLLRDADSALYRAKSAGKQRWHYADEAMHAEAVSRLTIEDELRRAIAEHELVVHYQPIVRLADRAVVGHEALVRWQHPERGLVPPLDFLPVAEESGLIVGVGDEVLRLVCETLVARPDLANVSVNLSPLQTSRGLWRERLVGQLGDLGVDPARISVEVTETAVLTAVDEVARELAELRALGIGVHLDDFGTGYSSIALLRDLPITGLKLDMSFTRRLTGDGGTTEVLAGGLAQLARGLGMIGIAEGVETEEQAALLLAMGWTHGQGWLFGRPSPEPA